LESLLIESITLISDLLEAAVNDPDVNHESSNTIKLLVRRIKTDTWRSVSLGDTQRPSAWLSRVRTAQWHAKRRTSAGAGGDIASMLEDLVDDLWLAESALPRPGPRVRVDDLRTATERSILVAFSRSGKRPLVRSEVHRALPAGASVSRQAVSKALERLYELGVVYRELERRRGATLAKVWGLTPTGERVADELRPGQFRWMSGLEPFILHSAACVVEAPEQLGAVHSLLEHFVATQGSVVLVDLTSDRDSPRQSEWSSLHKRWKGQDSPPGTASTDWCDGLFHTAGSNEHNALAEGVFRLSGMRSEHLRDSQQLACLEALSEIVRQRDGVLVFCASDRESAVAACSVAGTHVYFGENPTEFALAVRSSDNPWDTSSLFLGLGEARRYTFSGFPVSCSHAGWEWPAALRKSGLRIGRILPMGGGKRPSIASDVACWELARRCLLPVRSTKPDLQGLFRSAMDMTRPIIENPRSDESMQSQAFLACADTPQVVRVVREALEKASESASPEVQTRLGGVGASILMKRHSTPRRVKEQPHRIDIEALGGLG